MTPFSDRDPSRGPFRRSGRRQEGRPQRRADAPNRRRSEGGDSGRWQSRPTRRSGPRPERRGEMGVRRPWRREDRIERDRAAAEVRAPAAEAHAAAAPDDLIWGRHSTLAVLESGRPIHRVWCTPELRFSPRFLQLLRDAKASGVLVEEVSWARLGQISGGAVHQGIVLQPAAAETLDLPTLIEGCRTLGEPPLLIAVDGLTDPQNLGAIVRSAEALGAHGMVLPQRRNAGLTGSVAKVAAGALEHLPVARVVNLHRSLEALKEEGYRVVGLAGEGSHSLEEADLSGPLVVVTGSEAQGLSMLTRRTCDQLVRIPLRGATPSLNASVATALLLYEVARRGWMRGLHGTAPAPRLVRPTLAQAPPEPSPVPAPPEVPAAPASEAAPHPDPSAAPDDAEPSGSPVPEVSAPAAAPPAIAPPATPPPAIEAGDLRTDLRFDQDVAL